MKRDQCPIKKNNTSNPIKNEVTEVAVLGHNIVNFSLSTRNISDISFPVTQLKGYLKYVNIMHTIPLVQELNEDDIDRRLETCNTMISRINSNLNFSIFVMAKKVPSS